MASVTQLACNHLTSPYGYLDDDFGASSAMDNISEIIVIGAPAWSNVTLPGSIHIYEATDTSINYIKSIDGPSIGSGFGSAVSIDIRGDKIAVTANSISEVHIYTTNDQLWETYSTQVISKPGVEKFGHSISIAHENSNMLCIGSPSENNVYVYNDTTLVYTDTNPTDVFNYANVLVERASTVNKLVANDAAPDDEFGSSVAIDGDTAIVGANNKTGGGAAYIFTRDGTTWIFQQKLTANDATGNDEFGSSVAISGDYAIVAAPNTGAAYIFFRSGTTWTQEQKIITFGAYSVLVSKGLTGSQGYTMNTVVPNKDMVAETDLREIQAGYNPSSGSLTPSGTRYIWTDWGNDIFDKWGDFYIYNPSTNSATNISFANINGLDGTVYTETQTHHGKSFNIKHGWVAQGIFKLDVECSDITFQFSIGMYGDMGFDFIGQVIDRQYSATWGTLSYNYSSQSDTGEWFYSHCIPKIKTFNDGITLSGSVFTSNFKTAKSSSSGGHGDGSGFLALWTETLVLGATFYFVKGSNNSTGAMYDWIANDIEIVPLQSDNFGSSVAIDGDIAIVGARGDDTSSGSAYIFTRSGTTWTQQQKLVANQLLLTEPNDNFGNSVSISGDYVIVGASTSTLEIFAIRPPWHPDAGETYAIPVPNGGAAYIFFRTGNTWTQQVKLTAGDDLASNDYFGYSVAIDGDTTIVGAYGDESNRGSAYIFTRDGMTWTEQQKLVANDGTSGDNFGSSVAISGDYAIVGAYLASLAFRFKRYVSMWTLDVILTAGDDQPFLNDDQFGYSVAISGEYSFVGARFNDDVPNNSGSLYIFTIKDIYSPVQLIPQYNQYGFSVSMSGDGTTYIAGAPGTQSNVYNGYGVGYTSPGLDDISNRDNYYNYQSGFARIVRSDGADWANTTTKIGDQTLLVGNKDRFEVDKYSAFGYSTCTNSDGSIVAVGIPGDSGFAAFSYNILNDTWERAGDITLSDLGMGTTISMTYNGNRVCVGSSFEFTKYFGNSSGERKKLYQVYDYNDLFWSAYDPFDEIFSESGFTTSMSKNGLFILNSGNMSKNGIIKGGVNAEVVRLATTVKILGNTTVGGNLAAKNVIIGGGVQKTFPEYSGELVFSDTPGDSNFNSIIRNWNFKNDNNGSREYNNSNTYTSSELLIHKGGEYPDKLGAWGREPDRIRLQSRSIVLDTSYTDDTNPSINRPKFVLDTFGKIGINLPELQPDSLLIRDGFGPYKENIKARLDVNGTTTIRNKLDVNYRLKSNVTIGKQTIAFYDTRDLNCVDTTYLYDAGPREHNNNKLAITDCTYDTSNFGISINSGGSLTGTLNELGRNKAISFWLMIKDEQSTYDYNLIFYIGDTVIDGEQIIALGLFYNDIYDKGLFLCLNRDFTRTLKFFYTFEKYKWYHIYFELEGIYNI